jgi:transcriptional regulator with GAF, ATPase, and Fis domain
MQSSVDLRARATNLELLDELLAALIDSGELPDIFSRISAIAAKVLPHDAVALMVRLPDGARARVYASSGFPSALPETMNIPPELLGSSTWEADLFDELPVEGSRFALAASMGFRSVLRVRVRLDGQFAGALVFFSKTRSRFAPADVLVASRIADRLAVTLARDREVAASRRADEATARAARLESRVKALTEELDARTGFRRVVGESAEWHGVLRHATQVASNETTVLLLGESGTGKEVIARFVHRASPRKQGPFIALNCAALPEHLLEAELFGYERGAYTGAVQSKPGQLEQAAGGTLFLDEVAEMSLPAQAKFLRVLQEREFQRLGGTRVLRTDARVIAATNRDLARAIKQNQFREDLYYRLNVFAIYLPALRDRPADILPLCEAFLADIGRGIARPAAGISRDAREQLLKYHWPGNVRELRNLLERASILCDGGLIASEHLAIGVATRPPAGRDETPARTEAPLSSANELKSLERDMIEQALQRVRFNKIEGSQRSRADAAATLRSDEAIRPGVARPRR